MAFDTSVLSWFADIGGRDEMEDHCSVVTDLTIPGEIFAGIYDGHCGCLSSRFASETLPQVYKHFVSELGLNTHDAFVETFDKVSSDAMRRYTDGTCAVVFSLAGNTIRYANVGDSRLIVLGRYPRELTEVHRLTNPKEEQRIISAGGERLGPYVICGDKGLEPTRSLGDGRFKPNLVISTPHVGKHEIRKGDRFLVAASDGLFDVLDIERINELSKRKRRADNLLAELRKEARRSFDNVTIVVVRLK